MRSASRALRWLYGGLLCCLLTACVEAARSADVPDLKVKASAGSTPLAQRVVSIPPRSNKPTEEKATEASLTAPAPKSDEVEAKAKTVDEALPGEHAADTTSYEVDGFLGQPDGPVREALTTGNPVRYERGRGGRSLGFKITLDNGQVGYFKGEQTFSAANWFGEVAAFHLDRMLGIGHVPTVVSREFLWSRLAPAAGNDPRRSEMIVRDGKVRGAFVAWVDGGLRPLKEIEGWERWIRVKYWPSTAVTPFQRPAVWAKELAMARRGGPDWRSKEERLRRRNLKPEPDREDRPAELSDMIVFDYLTRNLDRWGGGNANVLIRGHMGELVFLDNAAGFETGDPRPSLIEARLHVLQRFRRRTIAAVRAFDIKRFEARLAEEPVQPVLNRMQLNHLEQRRKALLEWVAQMEAEHGEAIWAWE